MKRLIYLLLIITIFCSTIFCMNYGDAIVKEAEKAVNKAVYRLGYPPNYLPNEDNYCFAGHFNFSSWTIEDGFDCSGLVSWAAGLRRRYVTKELSSETYSTKISWDELSAGDLLYTPGNPNKPNSWFPVPHVMIYVGLDENGKIIVIHASSVSMVLYGISLHYNS